VYQTWEDFRQAINDNYDFTQWDGFGPEMNYSLYHFNYTEADVLAKKYLTITNSLVNSTVEKSNLTGKTIVITGKLNNFKNRGLLQEEIEKHGGKVGSSVTSKTDYLMNNDINSGSSKNVTAKKLGIPIITEEQLIAMF
jgi:DNA ligase (NAD+)